MQDLFVIRDGNVVVQVGKKSYTDSFENFILDGGIPLPNGIKTIDYNRTLGSCWINEKAFQPFPNEYAERVLSSIDALREAFNVRKKVREDAERAELEEAERIKEEQKEAERLANMTEEERLIEEYQRELSEKEQWLREHDYIGVKIATGRATVDDYASEIATMTEYAARIDELRSLISSLKETE